CILSHIIFTYLNVLQRKPSSVMKNQGENLTMACTTEDTDPTGLYLHLRCPEKHEVFYYDFSSKTLTSPPEFEERITVSGDPKKLTVTITSLRVNESGVYSCVFNFFDVKRVEKETNGRVSELPEHFPFEDRWEREERSNMILLVIIIFPHKLHTQCTVT
uniref:Ig-like domain-containing protein n=1 Tax=Pygocentrus nattereri TaxID=42514 RepID=A0A3B4BYN1_PYGNA